MSFLKNRTVVGVICILLSLLICFGLTPLFNQSVSQKAEIVRVVQPIRAGDEITESMVQIVEVGGYNLPEDVLRQKESAVGKYATADLAVGDYYKVGGSIGRYPKFVPEDYVILRLNPRFQKGEWVQWMQEMPPGSPPELLKAAETFSNLKLGFRGDLKFQQNPEVIEVAPLVEAAQTQFLDISFLM